MFNMAVFLYEANLGYAKRLVADLSDDQMVAQPIAGRELNHPAFMLGHLAFVADFGCSLLGHEMTSTPKFKETYSSAAKPQGDRTVYLAKADTLAVYEENHARLAAAAVAATPEILHGLPPERMRSRFPTVAHTILHMLTNHEAVHLGQLSAWRRALGLPSV